jgi:predicted secreted protein
MALYTGVTGFIKEGPSTASNTMVHMSSWEVELSRDMIEAVSFGDTYKEKVPAIKDWKAKAEGSADFASAVYQAALVTAFENGTLLVFGFGLSPTSYFTGSGYVESLTIKTSADNKADISISIAGSSGIVLTSPASGA